MPTQQLKPTRDKTPVPVAMTQDELDSDSDSDSDISSDEDDDDIPEDDDISANNLNDGYAKCVEAGEMDQSSLPAQKDEFWSAYLLEPLENHASRLALKTTPLPDVTRERLAELLDFVFGSKRLNYFWTVYPISKRVRKRLLGLWAIYMPVNVQALLAGQEPPSIDEIRAIVDANGMCCNEDGDRLDELEGRGEAQHRSLGAYWKVAFTVAADDEDDAEDEEEDVGAVEPLPVLLYTGQTATVKPTGKSMGFRSRWRAHAKYVYDRERMAAQDSIYTARFLQKKESYRMAFAAIVTVPVPVGTKLDIPFRNAVKFFARLSEAVCHGAFTTIYHAPNSRRTREHRTFWLDGPP
ncbi:hypothetical protein B9479_005021 [Cryptococcus floricola]|uniref:Uncharacterized protein n=1 Tax=Cryptococcus floricola TaxID=2591691 RepID=A0A5D3ASG3_9TREE|nr:hypothetical protein B9479_005021 [Cryptococcus floricola]